jgi:hypothetical protein
MKVDALASYFTDLEQLTGDCCAAEKMPLDCSFLAAP